MKRSHFISTLLRCLKIAGPVLALLLGTIALAQVDRAVLEGTVSDPTGATIVGATVQVLAVDKGLAQEQRTNSKGYYRLSGLAAGRYSVTVMGTGFKTEVIEDVIVQVGQTRTLDVELAVGVPTEKVRRECLL